MFFFHMPRSSIHPMPNSWDATSQARPKSCEISSLITEMRKGEVESVAADRREVALATVIAAIPARNSRRAMGVGIEAPPAWCGEEVPTIYHYWTRLMQEAQLLAPARQV